MKKFLQQYLAQLGMYDGKIDGDIGPKSAASIEDLLTMQKIKFEDWSDQQRYIAALQLLCRSEGLQVDTIDGLRGPKTLRATELFFRKKEGHEVPLAADPAQEHARAESSGFDPGSAKRLAGAHPKIQEVMNAAREKIAFTVMDSQRGRAAQEKAYREKKSKAHFGQSAHNWSPAVAVDVAPIPLDWDNRESFIALSKVIMRIAKEKGVALRWGGDWNMDGSTSDGWDLPHYELHPWRSWAKKAKPYGE